VSKSYEEPNRHIRNAMDHAKEGDFNKFGVEVDNSKIIDGILAKYTRDFRTILTRDEIKGVITDSLLKLFETAQSRDLILHPASYLFKTVKHRCIDLIRSKKKSGEIHFTHEELEVFEKRIYEEGIEINEKEPLTESEIKEGFKILKGMIPELGNKNVKDVMGLVIEEAENGVEDLSSTQISEILGLNESSVRVWKSRGFERLKDRAKQKGYDLDSIVKNID